MEIEEIRERQEQLKQTQITLDKLHITLLGNIKIKYMLLLLRPLITSKKFFYVKSYVLMFFKWIICLISEFLQYDINRVLCGEYFIYPI